MYYVLHLHFTDNIGQLQNKTDSITIFYFRTDDQILCYNKA